MGNTSQQFKTSMNLFFFNLHKYHPDYNIDNLHVPTKVRLHDLKLGYQRTLTTMD
jgi:hypothetical protein